MERDRQVSRRAVLGAPLLALRPKTDRAISGAFIDESAELGHRIRNGAKFASLRREERVPVVIVGGGIAGLSAAWRLDKRGFRDFVLLEMGREAGGNSRWGENEVSRYPWAAHYLPVPGRESSLVRELCEELGLLENGVWNERALCFSPQERLFLHGRWQEGLEPELAATPRDREQYRRFEAHMKEFERSGEFTIPIEHGARPSPLDGESMKSWMDRNGFDSPYLRWYVDYACRDDYGARMGATSAWAGIHYFASRQPDDKGPLTWPEGMGWVVAQMMKKLGRYVRTGAPVYAIRGNRLYTERVEYQARRIIYAAPTFTAHYVVEGAPKAAFEYSPWLTANLTLDRMPEEKGIAPAWDNVIYDSPGLGYVVATHMSVRSRIDRTVWTYYRALADGKPADQRGVLLANNWRYWKEAILGDLERAHPDIRRCVSRIDIMRLGHAMARPVPGFLASEERKRWTRPSGPVIYANSDLSGLSIFEEAQYRGVKAADLALRGV
jgi:glycine/D-amino acid oxidase-like deaminating enzyme